jgi:cell division protein FtsI (penicillin-binding protein 3)
LGPGHSRVRVRLLIVALLAVLVLLAGRAVQLAFSGDPLAQDAGGSIAAVAPRADVVDRNGVLMATTVRAYALTAAPSRVWDAGATADALIARFPDLDRGTLVRRLGDTTRDLVYLRRGLSDDERQATLDLGLAGIGFEAEPKRDYPQGMLAAHVLGFTDVDLNPLAGVERGLDAQILAAGETGRDVRLSLDVRLQYALETELAAAADLAGAQGASAILLDGRSGEVLALASWPRFDNNQAGRSEESARQERVAGAVHELGSVLKPFTVAMAIEAGVLDDDDQFNLAQPLNLGGAPIIDDRPYEGSADAAGILARSSNIGAAQIAIRVGGARQRAYLERLGFLRPTELQVGLNRAPIAPRLSAPRDIGVLGFGYGLAASPAALARAYTVFVNDGAMMEPTLLARAPDDPLQASPVFSQDTTARVLTMLRGAVTGGTGRAADVPGLGVAGKTGTAELRTTDGAYDESRNFSSFAGVFPANDPRYVIVVALDGVGAGEAGGAVAAPVVARVLRRAAPMLGLRVAEARD